MELRKQKEAEHYDEKAKEWLRDSSAKKWEGGDFEGFTPRFLNSYKAFYQRIKKNCRGKKVLDYGCGNGIHSIFPAKNGGEVIGIDLSEKSLEIARKRVKQEGVESKTKFLKMDCEKMDFSDNSFDIILDGGTFSSLDLNGALPELARVLKPAGYLIGIETFGHNPLTNLKRRINKIKGKRTGWAVDHIFQMKDFQEAGKYFSRIEIKFFHLFSWVFFPFLGLPGVKFLLKAFEVIDGLLLKLPFLRKYAFKVVFIFSQPRKNHD